MILDLIEEINGLMILLEGESLDSKERAELQEKSVEDLQKKLNGLKLSLYGF